MKSLFVVLVVMVLTPKGDTITCYHCLTYIEDGIVRNSDNFTCDMAIKKECHGYTHCSYGNISFEAAGVKYDAEGRDCDVAVHDPCAVSRAAAEEKFGDLIQNYECELTFCNTDLCNTELAAKLSTILLGGTVAIIAGLL